MKVVRAALVALTIALLTACSGASAPPPATPPIVAASVAADGTLVVTTTAQATVNTASSGCDAKKKPGDCWLPLYPSPDFKGDPLNLDPFNGSCTRTDQVRCWPQPGTTLTVVCQTQQPDGTMWFGAVVPLDHVFSNRATARSVTGGKLGYNKARWLQLAGGSPPLATCPA